jgi:hypothetical protein
MLCCRILDLTDISCGSWDTHLGEEWYLGLARQAGRYFFSGLVCVGHFQLRGLKGKKSTPSVGWEAPVKSHRSISRRCTERAGHRLEAVTLDYGTQAFIFHSRLILI